MDGDPINNTPDFSVEDGSDNPKQEMKKVDQMDQVTRQTHMIQFRTQTLVHPLLVSLQHKLCMII